MCSASLSLSLTFTGIAPPRSISHFPTSPFLRVPRLLHRVPSPYLFNGIQVWSGKSTLIAGTTTLPNIDNGDRYTVRIRYDGLSSVMWVYIQDMTKPKVTANVDLLSLGFTDNTAWVGFTATTGSMYFSQFKVHSFTFSKVVALAANSMVEEDGRTLSGVGESGTFTIDARDSCNGPRHRGDENWTVQLRLSSSSSSSSSIGVSKVTDLNNGRFSVTYVAPSSGTWEVWGRTGNDAAQHKMGTLVVSA